MPGTQNVFCAGPCAVPGRLSGGEGTEELGSAEGSKACGSKANFNRGLVKHQSALPQGQPTANVLFKYWHALANGSSNPVV